MAEQLIIDRRVLDANGDTLSGAKLYAYLEGTTTLEDIYSDEALTTLHPSPLVSDAGGNFPPIWHAGDHGVKIRVDDASDVELSWSPLDPCPMTSSATTAANISFTPTSGNPASNVQEAIENVSNLGRPISDKGANYTALTTDRASVLRGTATITISLTAASVLGDGWFVVIQAAGGDVTIDPDGSETVNGNATEVLRHGGWGTLFTDGTEFYFLSSGTYRGTEQATTSGTAFDWTGLPAGISELTLHLDAVSLSGTDAFSVQLGTSGGLVTSGYVANAATIFGSSAGESLSTSGVPITNISAGEALNGHLTFKRMDGDKWTASGSFGNSTGSYFSSGKVDLGDELTQIRLTRSGSNTFDAGAANISWRF